ncbi:hypothetical protein [Bacillus sp. P14.5]|nr:hypothetical protein [Bacillus sp. P14.5]
MKLHLREESSLICVLHCFNELALDWSIRVSLANLEEWKEKVQDVYNIIM